VLKVACEERVRSTDCFCLLGCVCAAGGFISAIFDETFGVLLYAAGRWGHMDFTMVFTARLEVDYKKV
jgi:hypothetical protein